MMEAGGRGLIGPPQPEDGFSRSAVSRGLFLHGGEGSTHEIREAELRFRSPFDGFSFEFAVPHGTGPEPFDLGRGQGAGEIPFEFQQMLQGVCGLVQHGPDFKFEPGGGQLARLEAVPELFEADEQLFGVAALCLLYTSPSPRD